MFTVTKAHIDIAGRLITSETTCETRMEAAAKAMLFLCEPENEWVTVDCSKASDRARSTENRAR